MNGKPKDHPRHIVQAAIDALTAKDVPVDLGEIDTYQAVLAASSLLLALGVDPDFDPQDHSRAAAVVRNIMATEATKTTTRKRRQV